MTQRPRLLCLPIAQPFESMASWLSRAALSQGVTVAELKACLSLDSKQEDDLNLSSRQADLMRKDHALETANLGIARRLMAALQISKGRTKRFLLYTEDGKGLRYRYCPLCLREQSTPHLPIHWRFNGFRYCRLHHCMLEDDCHHCGSHVRMPADLVSAGRDGDGIAYVTMCLACEAKLSDAQPLAAGPLMAVLSTLEVTVLNNGVAVLAALYQGSASLKVWDGIVTGIGLHALDRMNLLPHSADHLTARMVRQRIDGSQTTSRSTAASTIPISCGFGE